MEEESIIDGIPQKKSRHRKKLLYNSLKEQMEFYFSDVNISKDRFISQLIQRDPYIDLSVFLQFNKIRRLTEKISDLYKAVSKSDILVLSEDNMKVCRKTPIQVKENEDECTIYVERLPVDAEHDWLKNIFSKFGPVDYVSIPRYKHNKMIKGFAFIEFSKPETAKKALEYFESIGCKLPTTMLPDQLASISSFETEKSEKNQNILKQFTTEVKNENKSELQIETETTPAENSDDKVNQKKRKHIDENLENNGDIKKKKEIEETDGKEDVEPTVSEEVKESKKKNKKKQNQENNLENTVEETKETVESEVVETKESKKKKKKKENQEIENTVNVTTENVETEVKETSKKKKKKIENQEETENCMQESTAAVDAEVTETNETKKKKKKSKEVTDLESTETVDDNIEETDSKAEIESGEKRKRKRKKSKYSNDVQQFGLQVLSKKEWKQLRNKYLNLQRQKMQSLKEHLHRSRFTNVQNNLENNSTESNHNDKVSAPRFEFSPGVIVHITLLDSFVDIKKFKNDVRSQPGLQYVDIKVGSNVGYIRFTDNNSAKKFCESGNVNANMSILEGTEEKEYWDQILQSREQKFKKESKKQRGRDKLLRKAEKELGKHIKFDAE